MLVCKKINFSVFFPENLDLINSCSNIVLHKKLQPVQHFGSLSGFSINWSKSVLLPVDDSTISLPIAAESLKVVSSFKYLGVQVSVNLLIYLVENLLPLFNRLQMMCNTWCKFPLSVIGRIKLIKMVWGPQLLHIMHNSPQWIPRRWFNRINNLFRSLIWKKYGQNKSFYSAIWQRWGRSCSP